MNLLHEDLFSFSSSSFPLPPSNPIVHIQTGKENDCYNMNFNFDFLHAGNSILPPSEAAVADPRRHVFGHDVYY